VVRRIEDHALLDAVDIAEVAMPITPEERYGLPQQESMRRRLGIADSGGGWQQSIPRSAVIGPTADRAVRAVEGFTSALPGAEDASGGPISTDMMGDAVPDSKWGAGLALAGALPYGKVAKVASKTAKPATWFRAEVPGETKRIKTGADSWDSLLFVADNPKSATPYGTHVYKYESAPDAKILREGTRDFNSIARGFKEKNNPMGWYEHVVKSAKDQGYDAVWFKRQSDVGTAVLNPDKFSRAGLHGLSKDLKGDPFKD
jgi:hypothetical protein